MDMMDMENGYGGEGEQEDETVPMNWDSLCSNPAVWEVIKEELDDKLEAECILKIITAAKGEGMKDAQIFKPMVKQVEVKYEELEAEDPFGDTTED